MTCAVAGPANAHPRRRYTVQLGGQQEVGCSPAECQDLILATVRAGELRRYDKIDTFVPGDRVILVRPRP
jgi:hypothetical protein